MPLRTFTAEELAQIGKGAIRGLVPAGDTSDGSDYDLSARLVGAVAEGAQQQAQHVIEQIFPKTADAESLLRHADRYATGKQPAAKASGLLQITATSGTATQASGSAVTHADGTAYKTTAAAAVFNPGFTGKTVVGGSGRDRIIVSPHTTGIAAGDLCTINGEVRAIREVLASISAIELYEPLGATPVAGNAITATRGVVAPILADAVGASGNKAQGDTLTLAAPAAGVTAGCRVIELAGGGDEETDAQLAQRITDYEAGISVAGSTEHVREIARTTEGFRFDDAIVFPGFRGIGSVDVFLIGVPGARQVSADAVAAAQAALDAALPYHCDTLVSALVYRGTEDDVDVTVTTVPGYERDWISSGLAIASGSTVNVVAVSGLTAGLIELGDRVLLTLKLGSLWQTYQRTVTGIDVSTGKVTVDLPLPVAPVVGDPAMLPGGPLFEAVYGALVELLESLGPSAKLSGGGDVLGYERHPQPAVAWDDTLRIASVFEAAQAITGVLNTVVTAPAADSQPNPQETIRRGKILVRFAEP